jgi:hypothetical protein
VRENPLSGYIDGYLTHLSKFLLRVTNSSQHHTGIRMRLTRAPNI